MTPDQIRAIPDPEKRAREAQAFVQRGTAAVDSIRRVRDSAVVELRTSGWTLRRVATALGMSVAAMAKIDRANGLVSERRTLNRADRTRS